jgi:hypothetical protein
MVAQGRAEFVKNGTKYFWIVYFHSLGAQIADAIVQSARA